MIKNQTFNGLLIDCTNRCKICFSKQMAMMMEGMAKPKYQQITPEHKRFLGYHIFNGRFVTIRLNKLNFDISFEVQRYA